MEVVEPRVFISYSNHNKERAGQVKEILNDYNIFAFLAHDDIRISEEWKKEIIKELKIMNVIIPIISKEFKKSEWAPQEVGIAVFRDVLIIPLSLDNTTPFGFFNHKQGKKISSYGIPLKYLIGPILKKYLKYTKKEVIKMLLEAHTYRHAEEIMELLVPYYNNFSDEDIKNFMDYSILNAQVYYAQKCRDIYIPKFITIYETKIPKVKLNEIKKLIKR